MAIVQQRLYGRLTIPGKNYSGLAVRLGDVATDLNIHGGPLQILNGSP